MRGMRVPPEYLHRVIAERQGLDPSALADDDDDEQGQEEEDSNEAAAGGREWKHRPRAELGTNVDRYGQLEDGVPGGAEGEDDEQASTCVCTVFRY